MPRCFQQEIDLLKNLNHKNIVKYLGSSKTKSHLHIVLEYVENGSLANIIKPNKFGPFPESLVAVYIAQGLVKLADFGVATKLTEADVNTHSVVGTPYWMAPEMVGPITPSPASHFAQFCEGFVAGQNQSHRYGWWVALTSSIWQHRNQLVIEMAGVCAASDIWSVGCTVIELLTCVPPYYDLQPMPALFRIVQDEHPPIPDSLSPDITDFLLQCFKKDARQRPDAKTLLSHPWIQNCRRVLQSSLRHSGTLRNIEEDDSADAEVSGGYHKSAYENSSVEKEDSAKEHTTMAADGSKAHEDNAADSSFSNEQTEKADDAPSDQVLTLAIHEKSFLQAGSSKLTSNREVVNSESTGNHEISNAKDLHEVVMNGEGGSPQSRGMASKVGGKDSSVNNGNKSFAFGPRGQDNGPLKKAMKMPITVEGNELSRFSDPPGDAYLDDLFHPLDKQPGEVVAEASTSTSTSHMTKGNASAIDGVKNDLAKELRATIARKQWEKESEIGQANNGGNLLHRVMIGVLKDDVIDIDGLQVFDEKLPGENLFPLQAVEFSKLVGSLKPEESEDMIVSACQKLIGIFHQRPEQKIVFVTQHGLLPLTDLLEVPKTRIICSVLQLINQIVKDNTDFQENACLVGLIPAVTSFAVPDRPREIRMEAAYFLQQLCQSSSLTLQMFIACRGIPVLVGFLEADYAKYREMVHLAIDGMWQVFKLQQSTPRNDFCRIAAKNGILLRLINTLYSLNESTRLASSSAGGGFSVDGSAQRPRSGILDPNHPYINQNETMLSSVDQQDPPKVRRAVPDHHLEPSSSNPRRSDANYPVDVDRPQSSNATADEKSLNQASRESSAGALKERENMDRWKTDPSQPRISNNRTSTDRPPKSTEPSSNGLSVTGTMHQEQVRPLLSLLDKEPPSGRFSGQLEYMRQFSGLERHESVLPLLHATEKKTNGELDFLMAEFADVSQRGRENGNLDSSARVSHKVTPKKLGTLGSSEGAASTSGIASQTASGVLSGSGVLNARPGSATSSGLLSHMVSSLNAEVAREYLEKVADLLLEFAQADTTVKSYMCSQSLLSRLFQMFNRVEPPILLKILRCINHLSTDPNCLENLQRAEAIKYLIPNLELKEGSLVSEIHHEVLNALFNLCKINKRRQEQAAENGIIPHLMLFITSNSPLKQYALPLLCDMAHASRNSREQLRAHGGLDVYLNLLEDELWSVTALDSIAVCLAHDNDNRKVEQALLKKDAVQKLVKFFQGCPEQHFVHILEPFLKIITKSARINTTLAVNGLTPLLIARLDHQDAIARLNLLRLIKAVYEHHPQPKKLIVENDLPEKLQNLIGERRDGQVLVKQMATSLLKALHINTVL
ncbi:MAP3K epsilon protein kinase 1 [Glycine max]|nr:MAP3K epsilon protein kinase 1 [Glycine max]